MLTIFCVNREDLGQDVFIDYYHGVSSLTGAKFVYMVNMGKLVIKH